MNAFPAVFASWWLPLIVSPFIGSFLGVLISRLPAGEAVVVGRSRAPRAVTCWARRSRAAAELVGAEPTMPILRIADRLVHPGIEMAAMVVPIWAATEVGGWLLWASCALGWVLLTLAVIDARHLLLPDVLTLPLLAGGLAVAACIEGASLNEHAIGAIAGFVVFWLIALGYRLAPRPGGVGTRRRKILGGGGRLGIMAGFAERNPHRRGECAGVRCDKDRRRRDIGRGAEGPLRNLSLPWHLARLVVRTADRRLSPVRNGLCGRGGGRRMATRGPSAFAASVVYVSV